MKKRYDYEWGYGSTTLFLDIRGKSEPRLLDVEFDGKELHQLCGGKTYYVSRSGASGAGYFNSIGSLIPCGLYRVDTAHNDWQAFLPINGGFQEQIFVAVPYASHEENKLETLQSHPTIVKVGKKVIYCDFETNFLEVLSLLLSGEGLPDNNNHRTLRKIFYTVDGEEEDEIILEHYNWCSMNDVPNPWEFFQHELEYYLGRGSERLFQLLSVEKLENDTFVQTVKFANRRYRGKIIPGNPLETGDLTAGWQRAADDAIVRFYDGSNEAHLVAYAKADEAYGSIAKRLANHMGEGEEFISSVSDHYGEYAEFELLVPKALYLLNPAAQLAEARKGLARKIREDVIFRARQWVEQINDQTFLKKIPDDMIITIADSLEAGNCRPGTEAFIAQYFPGQTEVMARELKKYADNYNVMRIFHYLVITKIGRE